MLHQPPFSKNVGVTITIYNRLQAGLDPQIPRRYMNWMLHWRTNDSSHHGWIKLRFGLMLVLYTLYGFESGLKLWLFCRTRTQVHKSRTLPITTVQIKTSRDDSNHVLAFLQSAKTIRNCKNTESKTFYFSLGVESERCQIIPSWA